MCPSTPVSIITSLPMKGRGVLISTCRSRKYLRSKFIKHVKPWSQAWPIAAGAYPSSCSMKRLEVFLLPLDGMLVHRRSHAHNFVRFSQQFTGTNLYTWVERGTVRVKCLAQEHDTTSPAKARTRTTHSRVERTNHEAITPPTSIHTAFPRDRAIAGIPRCIQRKTPRKMEKEPI